MASALPSPSALSSIASSAAVTVAKPPPKPFLKPHHRPLSTTLAAAAAAAVLLSAAPAPSFADPMFNLYYGTAASAANYGGYGGNADKKATAEYTYEVPEGGRSGWCPRSRRAPTAPTASSTTPRSAPSASTSPSSLVSGRWPPSTPSSPTSPCPTWACRTRSPPLTRYAPRSARTTMGSCTTPTRSRGQVPTA
ncbi:unnamed protein product [Musa textilis]